MPAIAVHADRALSLRRLAAKIAVYLACDNGRRLFPCWRQEPVNNPLPRRHSSVLAEAYKIDFA
jgi:hypothetical protein